jgi:hypothetical protein
MCCVDEVLFGSPYIIPEFLIKEYNVKKIVTSSWNHLHYDFRYTNVKKGMLDIIDTTNVSIKRVCILLLSDVFSHSL